MQDSESNQIVVKSNRLIEASYRLTTQEQRIILFMASMVKKDDEDFQTYRIKISEFVKIIGAKGNSKYHDVKLLTKKLLERVIVIKEPSGDLQIGWVSSAKYYDRKGFVELHFDPKLKPYLLKIKEYFTKYQLKDVIRLKRSYSIRIYELLKQYEKIGKRTFTLDELRNTLGIGEKKYKLYGHIKNKIIKPVQKELNEQCDLTFKFEESKKGRKVVGIEFLIVPNKQNKACLDLADDSVEDGYLYQRLQDYFCLSEEQAKEIIAEYSYERIMTNMAYVEDRYKSGKVKDIGPYTIKAIKENYNPQRSLFDTEKEKSQQLEKQEKIQQELEERLKRNYDEYRLRGIEEYKQRFSQEDIKLIEESIRFEEEKKRPHKMGLKTFVRLAMEKHFAKQAGIPPFKQWKEQQTGKPKNEHLKTSKIEV